MLNNNARKHEISIQSEFIKHYEFVDFSCDYSNRVSCVGEMERCRP